MQIQPRGGHQSLDPVDRDKDVEKMYESYVFWDMGGIDF